MTRNLLIMYTAHAVQFTPGLMISEYTNNADPGVWISIIGIERLPTILLCHVSIICGWVRDSISNARET